MKIVVTGGAGFIGSNIVQTLNRNGIDDIIVVDDLHEGHKFHNIVDLDIADYFDAADFIERLGRDEFGKIDAIIHQGACSDTTERDGRYMMANNYQYSKDLLEYCLKAKTRFLYASSAATYGASNDFRPEPQNERPLNVYGYSKLAFDRFVRRILPGADIQIAGFRYFNVYGPREQHKGRMASVAFHHFHQLRTDGHVRLFGAHDGYPAGGQMRDFVSVDDVAAVNYWFLTHPEARGIFNLGTGRAEPFNAIAFATINAMRVHRGLEAMSLDEQVKTGLIRYIDFPEDLKGKYQSFTQADVSALRNIGYDAGFATVDEGVTRYIDLLARIGNL